jgi:hypothetical protein
VLLAEGVDMSSTSPELAGMCGHFTGGFCRRQQKTQRLDVLVKVVVDPKVSEGSEMGKEGSCLPQKSMIKNGPTS